MYVAAQRVRSPSREGINAFLSLHPDVTLEGIDWSTPSLEKLVDEAPGILMFQECEITPGGNHVRSFLDVVARNLRPAAEIRAALLALIPQVAVSAVPFSASTDGVAIRFDTDSGLVDERADEYRLLADRIVRLLLASPFPERASAPE